MKLQPAADRLKAAPIGLKGVERLDALAEIGVRPSNPPFAYVVPDEDVYTDVQDGSGILEQLVTVRFGVVLIVATGGAVLAGASDLLEDLESATIDCLYGWMMPGGERPLKLRRARLLGIGGGRMSRMLTFETVHRQRKIY